MELIIQNKKTVIHQVRLDKELDEFIIKVSKDLSCSKSEAIRAMVRFCKNVGWKNGGKDE